MQSPSPFEPHSQPLFWQLASGFSRERLGGALMSSVWTLKGMWPPLIKTTRSAIFAPVYVDSSTTVQAHGSGTMKSNRALALCLVGSTARSQTKACSVAFTPWLGNVPTDKSAELIARRDGDGRSHFRRVVFIRWWQGQEARAIGT